MYKIYTLASARAKTSAEESKKRRIEQETGRDSLNAISITNLKGGNTNTSYAAKSIHCHESSTNGLFDPFERRKSLYSNFPGGRRRAVIPTTISGGRKASLEYLESKKYSDLQDRKLKLRTLPVATPYRRPFICSKKRMHSQKPASSTTLDSNQFPNQISGYGFSSLPIGCPKLDQSHAKLCNTNEVTYAMNIDAEGTAIMKPVQGKSLPQQSPILTASSSNKSEEKRDLNGGPAGVESQGSDRGSLGKTSYDPAIMPRVHNVGSPRYIREFDKPTGSINKDSEANIIATKASTFGFSLASWKEMCIDWFRKPLCQYGAAIFNGWKCARCTFINNPKKSQCVVCHANKSN